MSDSSPTPEPFSKETLKLALKAFKKRLKLTKLDYESRLGYGPMSNGGKSQVVAITPPNQYPMELWQLLAKQGRLKHVGHGLYEMIDVGGGKD